jgi:hypothetical protein
MALIVFAGKLSPPLGAISAVEFIDPNAASSVNKGGKCIESYIHHTGFIYFGFLTWHFEEKLSLFLKGCFWGVCNGCAFTQANEKKLWQHLGTKKIEDFVQNSLQSYLAL